MSSQKIENVDNVVTLSPYFTIKKGNIDKFKEVWKNAYQNFKHQEDAAHYAFTFSEDNTKAHCREGYRDAKSLLQHIEDVKGELTEILEGEDPIAELARLEVHGPKSEIDTLREPLKDLVNHFYVRGWGFRNLSPFSLGVRDDDIISLAPYFRVNDIKAFKEIWKEAYPDTQKNAKDEKSVNYSFNFTEDNTLAYCRESYETPEGLLLHLKNVDCPLKKCLDPKVAKLERLEIHGPKASIDTLRPKLSELDCDYYHLEWGFRN